jgi:hypothetical protein
MASVIIVTTNKSQSGIVLGYPIDASVRLPAQNDVVKGIT